jgi:hypothetical protein
MFHSPKVVSPLVNLNSHATNQWELVGEQSKSKPTIYKRVPLNKV